MGRGKRKRLSGGSGTVTSPKQEGKRGYSDEEFSSLTIADSGEHDEAKGTLRAFCFDLFAGLIRFVGCRLDP